MYNIFHNSNGKDYNYKSFSDKMIQICNTHRLTGKTLVFAFILYDFENPQIFKVLHDTDYWRALDKISGKYLSVFSINRKKYLTKKSKNGFSFLHTIKPESDSGEEINNLVDKYFSKMGYVIVSR